jgi:dynactin complex subunit
VAPAKVKPLRPVVVADVGKRVVIRGYSCHGTLRFIGLHHKKKGLRVGVELDNPDGKNDGTVGGHSYFTCAAQHGVLTIPEKVVLQDELMALDPVVAGSELARTS